MHVPLANSCDLQASGVTFFRKPTLTNHTSLSVSNSTQFLLRCISWLVYILDETVNLESWALSFYQDY